MTQPTHPDVTVQLPERDGNAMPIIAAVNQALRRHGYGAETRAFTEQAMSGDYNHVLTTAMKWVNVEDEHE
jgi:hypothetical protein